MPAIAPLAATFLDPSACDRGLTYYRDDRVLELKESVRGGWDARVQGRERRPYKVNLALIHDNQGQRVVALDNECSCYLGGDCKHVAAVLFALDAEQKLTKEAPAPSAQGWLEALERTLDRPESPTEGTDPATRDLAYRIAAYEDRQVLRTLNLELGRLAGRKGSKEFAFGRKREVIVSSRYPLDPHHRVEALLAIIYPSSYGWDPGGYQGDARFLEHPEAAALVRAMARTERLYYGDDLQTPLRWGAPREAAIAWQVRADLQQQLGLDLPQGVRAILGEAAVYIDPAAREVGPLQVSAPQAVQLALGEAPCLGQAEAEGFRDRLTPRLQEFIPPPRDLRQRKERLKPEPQLVLSQREGKDGALQLHGHVSFRYGEHLVEVGSKDWQIRYVDSDGDTVVTAARQKRLETKALEALGLPLDAKGRTLLGPMDNVQAYATQLERLAPLTQKGWKLVESDSAPREIIDVDDPVELTVQDGESSHWFDLRMGVEVNGEHVDLAPLIAAALERPEIGLKDSDWGALGPRVYLPLDARRIIALPTKRLQALMGAMRELLEAKGLGLGNAVELTHLLDTGDCVLRGHAHLLDLARRLRACEVGTTQPPPENLQATLRPYQQHGLNWLAFLRAHDLAGVLADDMGLGKTLQTIAHLLGVLERGEATGPFLVVMPTSLLFNWSAELARFAPDLQVHLHHGTARQLEPLQPGHVLLTSYGVLLRDAELLAEVPFDTVVLDEAHAIKNPRTKLHHAARDLKAKHRLCLTGTPLQNNLEELWAQFAFLMPGLLDNHSQFTKAFRTPIEKHRDPAARAQLSARIRPFMLRRNKAEVARELPAKTEMVEQLELVGGQRDLYETVRNLMDSRVRDALAKRGIAASSIVVLDALLKLRQVCCDPRLVKTAQAKRVKDSAKLTRLLELVQELTAEGRRVLVFSQFTSMLALIAEALDAHGIAHVQLTGKTRNRAQVVQEFQNGTAPVFLLSLKAGGVGLNLTAADTVIHYDPWWNPSAENQATDRAHRIGQDKPVFVYKLIVAGSVEERILEMQRRKLALSQTLVDDGAVAEQLTQADLDRLFAPLA